MPWTCFSYPADAPLGVGNAAQPDLRDPLRMVTTTHCFGYPADMSPGPWASGVSPSGPRRMTNTACFRY
jgi:hypothetical protein